jgi:hypothetical protein
MARPIQNLVGACVMKGHTGDVDHEDLTRELFCGFRSVARVEASANHFEPSSATPKLRT